jgi:hypothetical protein
MKKRVLSIINNILLYAILILTLIYLPLINEPLNSIASNLAFFVIFFICKKVFKLSEFEFFLLLVSFYLGFIGNKFAFGLYYKWSYYDKVTHFVSWLFITIIVMIKLDEILPEKYRIEKYLIGFFGGLGIAGFWEIDEYLGKIFFNTAEQGVYNTQGVLLMGSFQDTMLDMIFTSFGAMAAIFIYIIYKKIKNDILWRRNI